MSVAVRALAVLTVALAASACSHPAATAGHAARPPARVAAAEVGSDVGNDRPKVTYDGLMVRRRVVIAIHTTAGTDVASLRRQLDLAASRRHTRLAALVPSVLDPIVLERLAPDLAVVVPAGTTPAATQVLMDAATADGSRIAAEVQAYEIATVLVHDLRFSVDAPRPAALSRAIAREGILSDALGNYTTTVGSHELDIAYTGPLLGDRLVESVRNGIARRAHLAPEAVAVSPRSTSGVGVDMAREPAPAAVVVPAATGHLHDAALPTADRPSRVNLWIVAAPIALVALLGLLPLLLVASRPRRRDG